METYIEENKNNTLKSEKVKKRNLQDFEKEIVIDV